MISHLLTGIALAGILATSIIPRPSPMLERPNAFACVRGISVPDYSTMPPHHSILFLQCNMGVTYRDT